MGARAYRQGWKIDTGYLDIINVLKSLHVIYVKCRANALPHMDTCKYKSTCPPHFYPRRISTTVQLIEPCPHRERFGELYNLYLLTIIAKMRSPF